VRPAVVAMVTDSVPNVAVIINALQRLTDSIYVALFLRYSEMLVKIANFNLAHLCSTTFGFHQVLS